MRLLCQIGPILCVALLGAAVGCRRSSSATPKPPPATIAKPATAQQTEVEDQLKSAIYQLQPENLGIDARLDDAVSVLNNWWAAVKAAGLEPTGLTPPAIPAGRLPDELRPRLESEAYDMEDGRHIRAAYLAKTIADRMAGRSERDLDRVTQTFDWVCRNVALVADDEPLPPLTFYELLVVGRGRAADRAWVFGEILKQLKLDTVVLRVKDNASGPLLVGTILEHGVYLFDPQLGLPIPRGDESTGTRIAHPATLEEIREHPDWLKTLSARSDQPYEPTAEQLADPRVEAISEISAWSSRMWKLEQLLPGESLCFVYEAPDALGDAPGLFARVAAANAGWEADKIALWTYPLQRQIQFGLLQRDPNGLRILQSLTAPLSVPVVLRKNDGGEKQLVESMRQLKTRTIQLQGQYADAISHFVTIRQLAVSAPPDPAWRPVYQRASEDAFYWSCVSKYESEEYESAVTSLADYLKRFRRGRWVGPAALLLAECHRELGHVPEGIQALKAAAQDDAYRTPTAVLAKRWAEAVTTSTSP